MMKAIFWNRDFFSHENILYPYRNYVVYVGTILCSKLSLKLSGKTNHILAELLRSDTFNDIFYVGLKRITF